MTCESQIIEWKDHWRDGYLRWVCGFANSRLRYVGPQKGGHWEVLP